MTKATISHTIEDESASVTSIQQYGMIYPDGTTIWGGETSQWSVSFKLLAEGNASADETWGKALASRARNAAIPLADYEKAHRLIRRTIVVAVTEPEDVS